MADEKQHQHTAPKPGAPKSHDQANDPALEILRLQAKIAEDNRKSAELQLQAAELNAKIAEGRKDAGVLADAERREAATVARIKADREECLRKLQEGENKYWVHLAHQLPTGRSIDHPELLVGGCDEREAEEKYKKALGIIFTPHRAAVIPAIEGEEAPSAELIAKAEEGYLRQV